MRMDVTVAFDHRAQELRACGLDVEGLCAFAAQREGRPPETELSVTFVTDERMRELNSAWRGIDAPTDVLSFECDNVDDGFSHVSEPVYELGDIVIAPDVCERQAAIYGMTWVDEMSLLLVHGVLHLCGWDHQSDAEAHAMEERERELLSAFYGRPFKREGRLDSARE